MVALVGTTLLLLVQVPASASTNTVNTLDDELNSDGDCSLREAIEAANSNAAVDACAAGEASPGVDVIGFGVTGTITLTSGQLTVGDDLVIVGPGAASLTISGGDATRVFVVNGTLELMAVTVADGSSLGGSGILNNGNLTVWNSTFSGNAAAGGYQFGGAIGSFGTLTVTSSTFSGNTADGNGGAIANAGSSVTVLDSTFSGNSAAQGGAIDMQSGSLDVTESSFFGNSSTSYSGGAIDNVSSSMVQVADSTFEGNSAADLGGGIMNYVGQTLLVTNSTFSGNSAGNGGGGIHNYTGATLTVTNGTFSGNFDSFGGDEGGAIRSGGALTLQNTLVANSPSGANCFLSGSVTDGGGNLSWPDASCPGINQDPLLDPAGLQENGGSTQTIALEPGSPAIDAAVLANCPSTDQRGVLRPQGDGCDIGAFELEMQTEGIQSFTVNPTARIAAKGRVQTAGSITCTPAGDRFGVDATLSQDSTGAVGAGSARGACSESAVAWAAFVRRHSAAAFVPGPATVCFVATTTRGKGTIIDREEGCAEVTIAT
jgi:CSLREA domain-containing protein